MFFVPVLIHHCNSTIAVDTGVYATVEKRLVAAYGKAPFIKLAILFVKSLPYKERVNLSWLRENDFTMCF